MLERIKKNIINVPGKRLTRKLLVFESDDWGSVRIPDAESGRALTTAGFLSEHDPFSKYDALEKTSDLENVFSVLDKFKDTKGNSPVITANMVMGNPDFTKIKASDFSTYYFEAFDKSYQKYHSETDTYAVLQKGIAAGLFFPQFHAREHLNASVWMQLLRDANPSFRKAFEYNCFAIDYKTNGNRRSNLMAAYDYRSISDFVFIEQSINEGLALFEKHFGFPSETTIAPCYVWDSAVEDVFGQNGIRVFQGSRFQNIPQPNEAAFKKVFHHNGEKVEGKIYLSRNGLFEPSVNHNTDWVDKCMESIAVAFRWKKPAVIGTHRLNYIGSLEPKNSSKNLKDLELLLTKILQKWPDVEFVSSAELANMYR